MGTVEEIGLLSMRIRGIDHIPEFPTEQREQLHDTPDFPPFGSPNARPDLDNGNKG